jgi:WD40 repeat protein
MSSSEVRRGSPYQGLIPYDEADAPFFFGREKETRLITANLFASPLTLLYGASGVGKSSVLRAGVARQLREREDLLVVVFNSWQRNPVSDLIQAIADQAKLADAAKWSEAMSLMPRDSEASLGEFLAICASQLQRRLMIILDQFEEYFLYHPVDDEFAAEFCKAVTKPQAPVSFLISIREDFYAKLDRFEGRIPSLYDNYLRIEHLDRKAARIAIEKPIVEYNQRYADDGQFMIEPELVSAVLSQVETGQVIIGEAGRGVIEAKPHEDSEAQIETPFLQLVMTRIWEKELADGSHRLQLATLERLGGAENIVRTHLDAVIARLTPREQDVAASIFHYLVTPSGTKIAYSASDLAGSAELSEPEVFGVLEKLSHGDVRILRPVDPPLDRPTAPRYEIFHDVLAPAILTWRTNYVQAQERAEAERRAEEQQQRADEQAAIARRFRRLAIALAIVILLALGTAIFAVAQTVKAKANATRADNYAQESQKLRVEGQQLRDEGARLKASGEDARRAAMIANAEAQNERRRTEEQIKIAQERKAEAEKAQVAASVATSAAAASKVEAQKMTFAANEQARAARAGYASVLALQSRAAGTEFPQRSLLLALEALNQVQPGDPPATAGEGALRQALSQTGGQVFLGHKAEIKNVDISPNNHWLLSSDESGVTYLWDLDAPATAQPRQLQGADSPTIFSDDNRWLVTGSIDPQTKQKDTAALVWDLGNLAAGPRRLAGHEEPVTTAIFAPNKRWLVTGSSFKELFQRQDTKALIWDLENPAAKPFVLAGERNVILGSSSDQRWLVTDGRDQNNKEGKSVSLWDLRAANPWAKPIILSGQNGQVTKVAFSSDGHWLATASSNCSFGKDTSVRVWDLTAVNPAAAPTVLTAHNRFVSGMVFSPDGKMLVTGGDGVGQDNDPCGSDSNSFLWNLTEPTKPPINLGKIGTPYSFVGYRRFLSADYTTQGICNSDLRHTREWRIGACGFARRPAWNQLRSSNGSHHERRPSNKSAELRASVGRGCCSLSAP